MTDPHPFPATAYRMAPSLAVSTLGRGLVTLGALVVGATLLDVVAGTGLGLALGLAAVGVVVLVARVWWLLRRWVLRLTDAGYAVRGLPRLGVARASWAEVASATATSSGGVAGLVLRLHDGRTTALPMAALAADREVVATDVQRRLRDAHMPGEGRVTPGGEPDSAPADESL